VSYWLIFGNKITNHQKTSNSTYFSVVSYKLISLYAS